jgi:hypothetical protein
MQIMHDMRAHNLPKDFSYRTRLPLNSYLAAFRGQVTSVLYTISQPLDRAGPVDFYFPCRDTRFVSVATTA